MQAGKLRHRIEIQQRADVQDATTGEVVPKWSNFADVWASVEPLSAREFVAAQEMQSKVMARITIRYREGLDPSMRILHRGTVYNIEGRLADNKSGLEYITIPCSAGVNNG